MSSSSFCCVPSCTSSAKKDNTLSFHVFPERKQSNKVLFRGEKVQLWKLWMIQLRMGKKPSKYMKVCSLHFTESDFFKGSELSKLRRLKRCAVPTCNLPISVVPSNSTNATSVRAREEREDRAMRRRGLKEDAGEIDQTPLILCSTSASESAEPAEPTDKEIVAVDALLALMDTSDSTKITYQDFSVQVNTPGLETLSKLIKTDAVLCSFTGLQNFSILNGILSAIDLVYKDTRLHKLSIKDRVVLTFIKLKLDLTFAVLAPLFQVEMSLCKRYIYDMLPIISEVLKCTINFPTMHEILKNMPICFSKFQDTQVVFDCTEIKIQKPKCLCCRIRFYSHYKSAETVKFMTGVSPSGLVTFVSRAYGGRASDKLIFEESKVIDLVEPGAAIMVDKGFLVEDLCFQKCVKMYRPPFLRQKKQLSKEEALRNTEIAAARVHIERSNQRIKVFKILNGKLSTAFIPYVENIFIIICAVTNLSSPILAKDKFLAK